MGAPKRAWLALAGIIVFVLLLTPWRAMATDAYLALVCGREVALHGLPHHDTLTAQSFGVTWVDQQWLGQWLLYELERIGGLKLALVGQALCPAIAAWICARYAEKRASSAAVFVMGLAGFAVEGTYLSLRPQMFSLVAFAALLVLVAEDLEKPSWRVFATWPILALWANLHGAVLIGVGLVGLRALFDVVNGARTKSTRQVGRGILLGAISSVTPFVSPYWRELPGYFNRISHLQDSNRGLPIMEWMRPSLEGDWAFFMVVVLFVVPVVLVSVKKKKWPAVFPATVIVGGIVASMFAGRHMLWLGLVLAAYGPAMFDPIDLVREGPVLGRVTSLVSKIAPVLAVGAIVHLAFMSYASIERSYPQDAIEPLRAALADKPGARVVTSDRYSDWLLWHAPDLAGRVEFDVRFELLDAPQARDVDAFLFAAGSYVTLYPAAPIALVSKEAHPALAKGLRAAPTARIIWEDARALLVYR